MTAFIHMASDSSRRRCKALATLWLLGVLLFFTSVALAWEPVTGDDWIAGWYGDSNSPTGTTGPHLVPSTTTVQSVVVSSWQAGPGASVLPIYSNTISLIQAGNISSTTFNDGAATDAIVNNDYIYVNLTVNSLADLYRITRIQVGTWNAATETANTNYYTTAQESTARMGMVLVDPQGNRTVLGNVCVRTSNCTNPQSIAGLTANVGNPNLAFPQTYQLRLYFYCTGNSSCGTSTKYQSGVTTSNVVFIDNPQLWGQWRQSVVLKKTWVGAISGHTATLTPSGTASTTAFVSTATATDKTDTSSAYDINTGTSFNVSETLSSSGYAQSLACSRLNNSGVSTAMMPPYIVNATDRVITCAYTNTRLADPKITVVKQVGVRKVNTDQFAVSIKNASETTTYASATTTGTNTTVTSAAYTATANTSYVFNDTAASGVDFTAYTKNYSCINANPSSSTPLPSGSGTSFTLTPQLGDAITCTFVNDAAPTATLTLKKVLINNNGGTATLPNWTLTASGPATYSGIDGSANVTNKAVTPGTYALSESGPTGYDATAYSCVKNGAAAVSGNSIVLAAGDVATCTITNDDTPPPTAATTLTCPAGSTKYRIASNVTTNTSTEQTLVWPSNGSLGPQSFTFGTTGITATLSYTTMSNKRVAGYPRVGNYAGGIFFKSGRNDLRDYHNLLALNETGSVLQFSVNVPTVNTAITAWDVDRVNGVYSTTLGDWEYYRDRVTASAGAALSAGSRVTVIGTQATANNTQNDLNCGLDDSRCDVTAIWGTGAGGTARTMTYSSAYNGNATYQWVGYDNFEFCVANPTLHIIKDAVPNSTQSFAFDGAGTVAPGGSTAATNATWPDFSLTDNGGSTNIRTYASTVTTDRLLPGSYTITEGALPPGWRLSGISCTDPTSNSTGDTANRQANINLAVGETVTCVFTNNLTTDLSITKSNNTGSDVDLQNDTVTSGANTTYTIKVRNNGLAGLPAGTVVKDTYSIATMECPAPSTTVSCSGSAACPASPGNIFSSSGATLNAFPAGDVATFTVTCKVL